jgi:sugar/nucleoside kinase (ribokinase family)
MKRFHVYGIGNALVDMEFEVTPQFLKENNIEKGVMTLVDEGRQTELMQRLDGLHKKRQCGGSAANSMIALCQMGGKAFYSCKVSSDETGDFYYKDLLENGAMTNLSSKRPPGVTGKCMVFVTPDADRTMNTYLGITESLSISEIDEEALKQSEYLYIEGYLVASSTGKEAAIRARELAQKYGVKVALTFSDPFMVMNFRKNFLDIIGDGIDLIFANQAEACAFSENQDVYLAAKMMKKYCKSYAVTLGPKGAHLFDGQKEVEIVAEKVEAVDTNGAGDIFAGSFLYALTQGKSFNQAGSLACHAASYLVTKFGPRLKAEETRRIKKEILG